jgi:hypothetical protein
MTTLDSHGQTAYYSARYDFRVVLTEVNRPCGTYPLSAAPAKAITGTRFAACVLIPCAVVLAFAWSSSAAAGTGSTKALPRPEPENLWRAYPLDAAHAGTFVRPAVGKPRPAPTRAPSTQDRSASSGSPTAEASRGHTALLFMALAAATLVAGGVGAIAFRLRRTTPALRVRDGGAKPAAQLPFRQPEGGTTVANLRRMPWGEDRGTSVAADADADSDAPVEAVAEEAGESVEAELPVDITDVGAEVDAVLKSAREAAASIRRRAQDESARLRDEAEAATAEVQEARQILELERADTNRTRAEAEAYAAETRAAAEAFAEQIRTEAEREAVQIVEHAGRRLEAADAEVEQRVRQAEGSARDRVEELEADSKRYEARLESMLVVFRGMSSQLEELLGKGQADGGHDADAYDETLEDALRPDSASSHVE